MGEESEDREERSRQRHPNPNPTLDPDSGQWTPKTASNPCLLGHPPAVSKLRDHYRLARAPNVAINRHRSA